MFWRQKDNITNLCSAANAVFNGAFNIALNTYIRKEERSQIGNQSFYIKKKKKHRKSRAS